MSATHSALNLLVPHELRSLIRAEAQRRNITQRDFVARAVVAYVDSGKLGHYVRQIKAAEDTALGDVDRLTITKAEFDFLEAVEWMSRVLGAALCTGRRFRKAHAVKCVAKGWLRAVDCERVDGDGFHLEPQRLAVGYELTKDGANALAQARTRLGQDGYPLGAR